MLINTTTLQQISEQQFRAERPNVSFPTVIGAATYAEAGYAVVFPAPRPAYDLITHTVREGAPVLTPLGTYQQAWEVVALDSETVAANQARAQGQQREAAKSARTAAVAAIKVTTVSGKMFDGDEASQGYMVTAIMTAELSGVTAGLWTLSDNSRVVVTIAELKEALVLAASATNNMWGI